MNKEIRQLIKNSDLFAGLGQELIDKIVASTTRKALGAGEILFQKGDPADALWGVLSGQIVIEMRSEDGKEMVIQTISAGQVFGEVGVLDFGPRRVEARAARKSELFRLERKHFLNHLQTSPELCFRMFSLLCSHLRDTTENLENLALHKLPSRLAKRLNLLAAGSDADDGVLHIVQSDLARMLGVNRQATNRHLRVFEEQGLITLGRERIEILDQPALAELASAGQLGHQPGWKTRDFGALEHRSFASSPSHNLAVINRQPHMAGLMAIDAAEYSNALMIDAAGTLKRLKTGLDAVNVAIRQYQGQTVWDAGDRVLAEFPDTELAMQAALAIQEQINPTQKARDKNPDSLFRIGVHFGEMLSDEHRLFGEAINTAIGLTQLSEAGGIAISGVVRDTLLNREQLDLQYLGDHELRNVHDTVQVYSAHAIPIFKMLVMRAETLMPRRFRPAAVVAGVTILLAGMWFTGDQMGRQSAPLSDTGLSIAVLPFDTEGDPSLDYLAEGVPAQVRSVLSTVPGLRVIGGESSGYFSNRNATIDEIGRALQVRWVLRGSIVNTEDGIVARTQLSNLMVNDQVWEKQFHAIGGNSAGFGTGIVSFIATSLGIISSESPGLPQLIPLTTHPQSHALYLEAQSHIWRGRQRNAIKAVPLLQTAIEMDPTFAEAHAVLAGLYLDMDLLDKQQPYNPGLRKQLARQALHDALALKPDSPLVLAKAAQARIHDGDDEGALALAERALRIDPNNTQALRARLKVERNRQDWAASIHTTEQLLQLEPLSMWAMNAHWGELQDADRHAEALVVANRALAFYPQEQVPHAHSWAANNKRHLGDRAGAIESSRKGMPYGIPLDLWSGLDYDWEFMDDLEPWRAVVALVYVEKYDEVREILINHLQGSGPGSSQMKELDYLLNRGELEALAGNYNASLQFFEQAESIAGGGLRDLLGLSEFFALLSWSRQSHFSLGLLFAYRQTGQHDKADETAMYIKNAVAEYIEVKSAISGRAKLRHLYQEAQLYAIQGQTAKALAKLHAWMDDGVDIFTYIKWDPFLQSLRGNSAFESIVDEVDAELAAIRSQYKARQLALVNDGLADN